MGNGGAFFCSVVVVCSLPLFTVWAGSDQIGGTACAGEGHCSERAVLGRGAASRVCTRMIDTSQTLPLALIGSVERGVVDSCKSNYSHWVEPQTVDFYTADLYLILLSDHNDNFSKYNKKIVSDYSYKGTIWRTLLQCTY